MKKLLILALVFALVMGLCACVSDNQISNTTESNQTLPSLSPDSTGAPVSTETPESGAPATDAPETTASAETEPTQTDAPAVPSEELHIYSLKGPTSMGLVTLLRDSAEGKTVNEYKSTMCTAADEVTAALINGDADIALLPANAAATLFNKAGGFSVVAINTLGVLYIVENGDTVQSIEDLAGKTICLTGKGTTPEYALRYLLAAHDIEDQVTLEFKSEAQEVVTAMAEDVANIGLLPQPFVTAAMMQNENLRQVLDLNQEWAAVTDDSILVTGVTVVRNEILERYPDQIALFLMESHEAVDYVNAHPEEAAQLIVDMGIVAKAPIAQKAIPYCNLVCLTGPEMKTLLSGYLQTLFEQNPKAVGEAMPADSFYYTGE